MRELDLHGINHDRCEILVIEELNKLSSTMGIGELRVITGNSKSLQNKIIRILDDYGYRWFIPSYNMGCIIVSWIEL